MAIQEHKRKIRKEEQKPQRAKATKERQETAALKRSLARQKRGEEAEANEVKIKLRSETRKALSRQ